MNTQQSCIIKSDNIFSKLSEISTETKRWLVGKYFEGIDFKTDLSKAIPIYKGEKICHKKFNFTLDGGRCFWCNTFSLLTSDGDIIFDTPIPIECGSYRGQRLIISKSEIPKVPFGIYEKHEVRFISHILNIEKMFDMERMINKSCDASHNISISSLINRFLKAPQIKLVTSPNKLFNSLKGVCEYCRPTSLTTKLSKIDSSVCSII